ncbi:hypothetical protein Tco_0406798, partial [Tanacetum coccineum]
NGAEAAGEAPKSEEDVNGEGDDDDEQGDEDGFVLNENPAIVGGIQ